MPQYETYGETKVPALESALVLHEWNTDVEKSVPLFGYDTVGGIWLLGLAHFVAHSSVTGEHRLLQKSITHIQQKRVSVVLSI